MSARNYSIGSTIPTHGTVVAISDTAYRVESGRWVPEPERW